MLHKKTRPSLCGVRGRSPLLLVPPRISRQPGAAANVVSMQPAETNFLRTSFKSRAGKQVMQLVVSVWVLYVGMYS